MIQGRIMWWNQSYASAVGAGRRVDHVAVARVREDPPLEPDEYCRMSPIQTTGSEIPISTKIIDARSKSDLGLSADRMPTGGRSASTGSHRR